MGKVIDISNNFEAKKNDEFVKENLKILTEFIMSGEITEFVGVAKLNGKYYGFGINDNKGKEDFRKYINAKIDLIEIEKS